MKPQAEESKKNGPDKAPGRQKGSHKGGRKDQLSERQQTMNVSPEEKSRALWSGQQGQGRIASGTSEVFKLL